MLNGIVTFHALWIQTLCSGNVIAAPFLARRAPERYERWAIWPFLVPVVVVGKARGIAQCSSRPAPPFICDVFSSESADNIAAITTIITSIIRRPQLPVHAKLDPGPLSVLDVDALVILLFS